jgi:hypothetical protein
MRSWIAAVYLAASCVPVLSSSSDIAPPARSQVPPDLAEEHSILSQELDRKCDGLEAALAGSSGEQRAAILGQIAHLGTAKAIGVVSKHYDSVEFDSRCTLINIVAGAGNPASAQLLLSVASTRTGNDGRRIHAIGRLYVDLGEDARPHLLSLQGSERGEVLFVIKRELLRLKEPALVENLRQNLKSLSGGKLQDPQEAHNLLYLAVETDCTEVAEEVGELLQSVDWSQSDNHRHLKQSAADAALCLGHQRSVEHVIDLLKDPGSARFEYPGLRSLEETLRIYTKQKWATHEEWSKWWNKEGRTTPLFRTRLRADEEAAIIDAALTWGRSLESGPFIQRETVYLQVPHGFPWARAEVSKRLQGNVRVYTPVEMSVLGVRPYGIHSISSNGLKAYATLGDGQCPFGWRWVSLELERDKRDWKVVRRFSKAE